MNSELGSKRVSMPMLMGLLSVAVIVVAVFVTSNFSSAPPKPEGAAPAQQQVEAKPQPAQTQPAQPAAQTVGTPVESVATTTPQTASNPVADGQSPETLPPPPPASDHPPAD